MRIRCKVKGEFPEGLDELVVVVHHLLGGHAVVESGEEAWDHYHRHPIRLLLHLNGIFYPGYSLLVRLLGFRALELEVIPLRVFRRKPPLKQRLLLLIW